MDTIFKTLYGTISASSNTISFTDDLIIDSTIIDTYFSDDEIVVDDISVTNHTVTITIKDHSASVGIAVFINNCDEFIPFDDTEILNRITIVETDVEEKQDKLPDVVNDRYLHTNSVTGNLEWSTVQGGGSTTEYGTTAEFETEKDSLPVGTEYLVTDDYDSDNGFDYSEEEICVGTYMGKKRYVKICPVTRTTATSANTWSTVAIAPTNIERVIHIEFLRVNDALGTIVSQYSRIYNGNIELYNTFTIGATAMTNAHVLIEYTKVGD